MTVPWVVLGVTLEKISFSTKMSLSKQKKLYYQLVNKGRNRERKEDWRGAIAYIARKWMVCNFLMKLPDNFYSSVDGNFELWVLLGSFTRNVWNFSFDTSAKDFNRLCWIKITCLSATKYNVIFFVFFSLLSTVGKIISAEICQLLQKKMSQYSME